MQCSSSCMHRIAARHLLPAVPLNVWSQGSGSSTQDVTWNTACRVASLHICPARFLHVQHAMQTLHEALAPISMGCLQISATAGFNQHLHACLRASCCWLQSKRYALLGTFAFCQGTSLSPLVGMALAVNPSIVLTAALSTTAVFACFSLSALFTRRR